MAASRIALSTSQTRSRCSRPRAATELITAAFERADSLPPISMKTAEAAP